VYVAAVVAARQGDWHLVFIACGIMNLVAAILAGGVLRRLRERTIR
jgi:hypothetical protein